MNEKYIAQLVIEWDDVYKRGQLSLWILLALYDGKKYAAQVTEFMQRVTGGSFDVNEQSLYRALRRFERMKVLGSTQVESPNSGAKRKYYELTAIGIEVLRQFLHIHIVPLQTKEVQALMKSVIQSGEDDEQKN